MNEKKSYMKSYMLWMTETEKAFIEEMAWKNKQKMAQYLRELIHKEMKKHPGVVKEIERS